MNNLIAAIILLENIRMDSSFDFDYAFETKLIMEVKKHPLIYDFTVEDYKNTNLKEMTWNKIGFKICGNENGVVKCKKKWRNLRDMYKRCKIRKEKLIGQKKPVKDWKHEKIMQFLDKCINLKKLAISQIMTNQAESITNFDDENSTLDHNNETFSPIDDIKEEDSLVGQCEPTAEHFNAETLNTDSFNADELNEDSMSALSSASSAVCRERANNELGRAQEEKLTEFCAIKSKRSKSNHRDSLSLLFESLDKKIQQANLSEDQMTEIESSVFSLVFFKLKDYRKLNKNF